jgi:hypothetical protein
VSRPVFEEVARALQFALRRRHHHANCNDTAVSYQNERNRFIAPFPAVPATYGNINRIGTAIALGETEPLN